MEERGWTEVCYHFPFDTWWHESHNLNSAYKGKTAAKQDCDIAPILFLFFFLLQCTFTIKLLKGCIHLQKHKPIAWTTTWRCYLHFTLVSSQAPSHYWLFYWHIQKMTIYTKCKTKDLTKPALVAKYCCPTIKNLAKFLESMDQFSHLSEKMKFKCVFCTENSISLSMEWNTLLSQ